MGTSAMQHGIKIHFDNQRCIMLHSAIGDIWQLEDCNTLHIYEYTADQLRSFYANGRLTFANSNATSNQPFGNQHYLHFTLAQLEQAKVRRAYVIAIINMPNTLEKLSPVIREIWEKIGKPDTLPNPATVIRWKNKFVKSCNDYVCLVDHHNIKTSRTKCYPKEVTQIVQQAIDTIYLTLERNTVEDTYNRAYVLTGNENELRPAELKLPLPTRRLVARMIEAIPAFDRYAVRYGRKAAIKEFRHVQRHSTINVISTIARQSPTETEGIQLPDDMVQIDAILGRTEQRVLTHEGIRLYGLLYNSPELTDLRRQFGNKLKVEIRVNETDLGHILVLPPDKTRIFKVPAIHFDYANGLSTEKHRSYWKLAARELNNLAPMSWKQAKEYYQTHRRKP